MDLNKLIDLIVAGIVAWIAFIEVRLHSSQKKVIKLEERAKDEKIKTDVHTLSDAELDALLNEDFGAKRDDS